MENYLLIEDAHLKLAKAEEAGKRTNVKPISLRLEMVPQSRKGGCLFYKGEGHHLFYLQDTNCTQEIELHSHKALLYVQVESPVYLSMVHICANFVLIGISTGRVRLAANWHKGR